MTLTAHAIVGAGIAAAMPAHPVLGVCLAFLSHFPVDAIPHYDYSLRSDSINPKKGGTIRFDKALAIDLFHIGVDFLLGLALGTLFFATSATWPLIAVAAFAGMLPDGLQFLYTRFPREPLATLQRFHQWIHTPYRLHGHRMLGIVSQVVFLIAFVIVMKAFTVA